MKSRFPVRDSSENRCPARLVEHERAVPAAELVDEVRAASVTRTWRCQRVGDGSFASSLGTPSAPRRSTSPWGRSSMADSSSAVCIGSPPASGPRSTLPRNSPSKERTSATSAAPSCSASEAACAFSRLEPSAGQRAERGGEDLVHAHGRGSRPHSLISPRGAGVSKP